MFKDELLGDLQSKDVQAVSRDLNLPNELSLTDAVETWTNCCASASPVEDDCHIVNKPQGFLKLFTIAVSIQNMMKSKHPDECWQHL